MSNIIGDTVNNFNSRILYSIMTIDNTQSKSYCSETDKSKAILLFGETETDNNVTLTESKTKVNATNTDVFQNSVPDTGTTDSVVLKHAPNPSVTIAGEQKNAVIIVDISTNILYKYDKFGNPEIAYRIASGKKSSPTERGVRIVTHKEKFPYRGAPAKSKRRQTPRAFGPFIICLNKIDTTTGAQTPTGEFIHGTNEPHTPKNGMYASHGCMRMNNDVITKLKDEVERGDIVIVK